MIKNLFLSVINMSITASVAIVCVMIIRYFFRKQPKIYSYFLWGIVLFRLLCPYSLPTDISVFNMMPPATTENGRLKYTTDNILPESDVNNEAITDIFPENALNTDIYTYEYPPAVNNIKITSDLAENKIVTASDKPGLDYLQLFGYIWLIGIIYFVCSNMITLSHTKYILADSRHIKDNIYQNRHIPTAFIMGFLKPKIFIPCNLSEIQKEYIILHEKTHIRRKDYIFKLLGFAALCLHWFNPLVWLAFKLAENDMEMSCDEAVIKNMSRGEKREYSMTLLDISAGRPIGNMAIAFSEGDTKDRIKNVLEYIKPSVKYIVLTVLIIVVAVVTLMSNPSGPTIYKLATNQSTCDEIVLLHNNGHNLINSDNGKDFIKLTKKAKISAVENVPEETIFDNSMIFVVDNQPKELFFDSSYKYISVSSTENREEITNYYQVTNPQIIAEEVDNIINKESELKIAEVIYPAFSQGSLYSVDSTPFKLSFAIPENMYIFDYNKETYVNWHNMAEIYDENQNLVGNISFCKAPRDDTYTLYPYNLVYNLDYMLESSMIWENEYGHLLKAYMNNDDNFSTVIFLYTAELDCYVRIEIDDSYDTKITGKIIETIKVLPAEEEYKETLVDNRIKFRVKPDESEDGVANRAAHRYLKNFYTGGYYKLINAKIGDVSAISQKQVNTYCNSDFKYYIEAEYQMLDEEGQPLYDYTSPLKLFVNDYESDGQENYIIIGFIHKSMTVDKAVPLSKTQTVEFDRVVNVPFRTRTVKDNSMLLGTSRTNIKGMQGLRKDTVTQEIVNGIVIREQITDSVVLKEPVTEEVSHGTLWNGQIITGGSGKLIWPTAAGRVSRGFDGQYPAHNGVDIAGPVGTQIYAADDGVVTKALYTNRGYGVYLIIEHGGYQTLYSKCSELFVSVGEQVEQGQVIASMGSTGNSTGPHLHFEVKNGDYRYNPYGWF